MAKIDLAELKAAAEKATPGPWTLNTNYFDESWVTDAVGMVLIGETKADNEHIANCDPQTILAFIEAVEAALRIADKWRTVQSREVRMALASFTEGNA